MYMCMSVTTCTCTYDMYVHLCLIHPLPPSLSLSFSLSFPLHSPLQSTLLDCLLEQTHPELLLKEDKQVRSSLIYIVFICIPLVSFLSFFSFDTQTYCLLNKR